MAVLFHSHGALAELATYRLEADVVDAALTAPARRSLERDAAVTRMVIAYRDIIYRRCVRVLGDRVLAEDITQQVFLEAHRDLDRFEGRSPVRYWLLGIAMHRCHDALKARRRREYRIVLDDHPATTAEDPALDPRAVVALRRCGAALAGCLEQLSEPTRRALVLRYVAGMSYEDMARLLGEKADTLHSRVTRALPVLRRCLETKGWSGVLP